MAPVPRTPDSVGGLFERILFVVNGSGKVGESIRYFRAATKITDGPALCHWGGGGKVDLAILAAGPTIDLQKVRRGK